LKPPQDELDLPASLSDIDGNSTDIGFYPSLDSLDLSIDPFLEKNCDLLLDAIETHYTELNNFQYHQRQLAREQVCHNATDKMIAAKSYHRQK
jgi:translation initiation factor 3 subunit H